MSGGFQHEAGFYGDEDELLAIVTEFVGDAVDAEEPAVLSLQDHHADMLRPALGDTPGVTFLPGGHGRPAETVRMLVELFEAHAAADSGRLRIVGEVPAPVTLDRWEPWARYEAAVNRIYADFDVSAICAYDTRITPDEILADVERTHPSIATVEGHGANHGYQEPEAFFDTRPQPPPDPLERTAPALELFEPTPAGARRAVSDAAASAPVWLSQEEIDDFVYGINEALTNALVHGRSPVQLRLWTAADRLHAAIDDGGGGPGHAFAGLVPAPGRRDRGGGLGLWLAHRLCSQVTHAHAEGGFTIRLTARPEHPA